MNMSGYQQYKSQSINTMTSGELLGVLFDELLKRLLRAELALEKQEYEVFESSIQRASEIVLYLKDTLNFNYEISFQLSKMYDFFIYELSRIKARREKACIVSLRPLVQELRDAFRQAQNQTNL